ncbi:MAG: acetyl-CoA carboxylase biotin carboxyl carrier protein [Huintestinicola sp.]
MSEKIYGQFDLETIAALADIVKEKELGEITVTDGDKTITVKGRKCPPPPPINFPADRAVSLSAPAAAVSEPAHTEAPAAPTASGNTVKSPLVGTYYAAPAPDKAPFVTVGQSVKKGDVIMIIESMKLMNEIQSDFDGKVKEILVSNGQAVEYDQPIMIIG